MIMRLVTFSHDRWWDKLGQGTLWKAMMMLRRSSALLLKRLLHPIVLTADDADINATTMLAAVFIFLQCVQTTSIAVIIICMEF
jgi:hypothetical protein